MVFCPKTFNRSGPWIEAEHQARSERLLSYVNTAEGMNMAPFWKPASKHPYQYVRATRFSASRFWKESKNWQAVAQEQYMGVTKLPTSAPQTLRFVGNFSHPQPTSVRSNQVAPTRPVGTSVRKEESLTFVWNFTHPPHVTQDQLITLLNHRQASVPGSTVIHGVSSTQKSLPNPTLLQGSNCGIMHHAGTSTTVNVQMPAHQQQLRSASSTHQRQAHVVPNAGTTCLSSVPSAETVESLKNVKNLVTTPHDTAALLRELGPLKFVGNFSLPAEVLRGQCHNMTLKPTQVPGSMTQEGIMAPRVNPIPSTSAAPVSLSTVAFGGAPTHSQTSSFPYTREEFLKMMEHHSYMVSHYRELKSMAENMPQMMVMQSVSPTELQRKTGGVHDRSWDEETKAGDDGTGGIVLPDDAVEKLDAIPGILDLARQMGFLTLY
ncbi:hypothetical protein ACEWY4_000563 [Coilia grayii]|uniref:Uncharacterized protein n=1 Tax=Coilia grayii TaxID=363190 RepID=A0ABD1KX22_9TELE